jgi:glyoxylase-like metal-dependent hydrolase (beta-lactamase superfamily II)
MPIVTLESGGQVYTSQVYLVLGGASRLEDINTLVDVGQDPATFASLDRAPTGVGTWPVEQVVSTHGHSDHCALLPLVRQAFHPKVFAFSPNIDGVDGLLRDGDTIRMGEQNGRGVFRGNSRARAQQRLDLFVQRSGGRTFRGRLASTDHLASGNL